MCMDTARSKRPSIRTYLATARIDPKRAGELELIRLHDMRALKSAAVCSNSQKGGK